MLSRFELMLHTIYASVALRGMAREQRRGYGMPFDEMCAAVNEPRLLPDTNHRMLVTFNDVGVNAVELVRSCC